MLDELTAGVPVRCVPDKRDQENRLVAWCRTPTIDDLGEAMLRRGAAVIDRHLTVGTRFADRYDSAERAARTKGLGLWAQSASLDLSPIAVPLARIADEATGIDVLDIGNWAAAGVVALLSASLGAWWGAKGTRNAAIEAVHTEATVQRARDLEVSKEQQRRAEVLVFSNVYVATGILLRAGQRLREVIRAGAPYSYRLLTNISYAFNRSITFQVNLDLSMKLDSLLYQSVVTFQGAYEHLIQIIKDIEPPRNGPAIVGPVELMWVVNMIAMACENGIASIKHFDAAQPTEVGPKQESIDQLAASVRAFAAEVGALLKEEVRNSGS